MTISCSAAPAFGSDAPVELPNVFEGIADAATRSDASGEPFGGWQPQERLDRVEAIDAFTRGAAYAGFAEDRFGTLTPGMRADFILLDIWKELYTPCFDAFYGKLSEEAIIASDNMITPEMARPDVRIYRAPPPGAIAGHDGLRV